MILTHEIINIISENLKIKPLDFGFAGEVYSKFNFQNTEQIKVIGKYIFAYQNTCANRNALYYSDSFLDAVTIIEQAYNDYCYIYQSQLDYEFKRYVLFSIIEYFINAVSKLIHLCFENKTVRFDFYAALKNELENYMDILVKLMFSETLTEIPLTRNDLYSDIKKSFMNMNTPTLRGHVEYDHKLLLVYTYILYGDIINENELLLCPLLGAVQIPPFIKSMEKYFNYRFFGNRVLTYDYVKYSTYDISEFISLDEQSAELKNIHNKYSRVILLDESLGTGTTLLEIKKNLHNYFEDIKIGAVEFYWDKKIVWNYDRQWFSIDDIDFITPVSYRHYMMLTNQVACLKLNVFTPLPYVPFMIYDDYNFEYYMSKQKKSEEKNKSMDAFFYKSRIIKEVFYMTP